MKLSFIFIKQKADYRNKFWFKQVSLCAIENEINDINPKKLSTINCIPPKELKLSSKVAANTLQSLLNESLGNKIFPHDSKLADITPVSRKKEPVKKLLSHS